jgi:7-keto-8-aminopelargonate synthetase-like enzyme
LLDFLFSQGYTAIASFIELLLLSCLLINDKFLHFSDSVVGVKGMNGVRNSSESLEPAPVSILVV